MKHWHSFRNTEAQSVELDLNAIMDFCQTYGEDRLYTALYRSKLRSHNSGPMKVKTLEKILRNGFLHTDSFLHVNFIRHFMVKNPWNKWDRKYKIIDNNRNWTADLDRLPVDNLKDLFILIMERGAPLPFFAVQTSQNNFQVWYKGTNKLWTDINIENTCLLLAGCKTRPHNEDELKAALEAGGVDYRYFRQDVTLAKIRIPGTVNTRKGNFIVQGMANPAYSPEAVIEILNENNPSKIINLPTIENRKKKKEKAREFKIQKHKIPYFNQELPKYSSILNTKRTRLLSDYFVHHLKRAMDGTLGISQRYLAKVLGLSQATVSRILSDLVKSEFLWIAGESTYGKNGKGGIVKKYGLTAKIISEVKCFGAGPSREEKLQLPYIKGESNNQKLYDIRILYMDMGLPVEKVTDFVYKKFCQRTDREFMFKDVDREVRSYCKYLYEEYPHVRLLHGGRVSNV